MADRDPFVLDSSALMTFIEQEEGAVRVREVLEQHPILIPWLSLLEVLYITQRELGEKEALIRYALLKRLDATFVWEVDEAILLTAARLKATHRLSLADSIIAAIAIQRQAILLHKDPEYAALQGVVQMEALPYR